MSLNTKLCVISYSKLDWGDGFMCRIWDTGRLVQFAWNFEFLKNISIFLFFVRIFHNRKTKLKQIGDMKQHC